MRKYKEEVAFLRDDLSQNASPLRAQGQAAYMRNKFSFLGVDKPTQVRSSSSYIARWRKAPFEELSALVGLLWTEGEREFVYIALDLLKASRAVWPPEMILVLRQLIETDSWWDSVDLIAGRHLGKLVREHPRLAKEIDTWIDDENLWVRRSAIIYQLKYGVETDEKRLYSYILKQASEKEFFIQKAIGWALREYAKTAPKSVYQFVDRYQDLLAPLSLREAQKHRTKVS